MLRTFMKFALAAVCWGAVATSPAAEPPPLDVLFFGDRGHHRPTARFKQSEPVLAGRNIKLTYREELADLNAEALKKYPVVLLYANHDTITPEAETALLEYVENGGGLAAIHCASYCFRNSPKFVALVGAQFKRHGTGTFRETVGTGHELLKGYGGFSSWDETYVHHLHNDRDRTILTWRVDAEGREPWTWVRTQGKGRVFYTAWGHDERTWGSPGFVNLLERGLRWAGGGDPGLAGDYLAEAAFPVPELTPPRQDVKPFEYVPAKVAFYPPGGGRRGDGWNKMQLPLEPTESNKHYRTPVGFETQLFAAEPDIGKPLAMAWDAKGRLWLAESMDYPNERKDDGEGRDRIRICEDTDGDGKADKFTIFAEKLSIPTSLCFARGGVIVFQAPDTLFLKDTDGDDKSDRMELLFTGWDTGDTHAGPSNMQQGLDNWVYGTVGYAGFRGEIAGEKRDFRTGMFRFKNDGSRFEFLRNTNNNTWGIGISEEGLLFTSTANHNPSVYLPIPNRYYERVRGWSAERLGTIADTHLFKAVTDKIRQVDHHGGYTAAAGHSLYTARTYPQEYWNRTAFVAEPTGHLIGTFVLKKHGADFRSTNPCNILASDDEWAAPTMAEVGPDGNVWAIDWYNYIVQHNPTPQGFTTGKGNAYETDLRDKRHGRIYRIVRKDASPVTEKLDLTQAGPELLIATLSHSNLLWRRHAQRLLIERAKLDVVPALLAKLQDRSVDAIGLNVGVMHALWTLEGLGALDGKSPEVLAAVAANLTHPSAGVRRNAVAVLPPSPATTAELTKRKLLRDDDAQVRLATLLALADGPVDPAAAEAVTEFLRDPAQAGDRWLAEAATSAAATQATGFLANVLTANADVRPLPEPTRNAVRIVAEHWARGAPNGELGALLGRLAAAPPATAVVVLEGLEKGWPKNSVVTLDAKAQQDLTTLFTKLPVDAQSRLARLDERWQSKALAAQGEKIAAALLAMAGEGKLSEAERIAAAKQVVGLRPEDGKTVDGLLGLLGPKAGPSLTEGIIEAVVLSRSVGVGEKLQGRWNALTPEARRAAARGMLARAELTGVLLAGLEQGKIPAGDLALDQQQALAAHPNAEFAARAKQVFARGGGLPDANRQKVLESLLHVTKSTGNVAAGKEHFVKHCGKCHKFQGEGGKVGPDLTGMSVHPKAELLAHILDPSRSVEGNYRTYTLQLDDGRVLTGLLTSETRTTVELLDAEGKRHAVNREEIEELAAGTKSLMPEGFEKQVDEAGLRDVLEYLVQRPKYLPLNLAPVASVVSTRGMFNDEENTVERLVFADWGPKEFAGVPFQLVDPQGSRTKNVLMLHSPNGKIPPKMPKNAVLPVLTAAKSIHFLSGISGWGAKSPKEPGAVSMIARLHYADGKTEDHPLYDGRQFADYIGEFDVPESQSAFKLNGRQVRYFEIVPRREDKIERLELVKGPDRTAPVVLAVTVETR